MGLLYPGVDDEDVMQWYLNTHYLDGILDYQPPPSDEAYPDSLPPTTEPWYTTMAPRYIPDPSGKGSIRYTPEVFEDYLSSLTTEPEYDVLYDSYSAEPYLYATTPWGKGGGTPTYGFPPGMSPGDLATWDV